MKRNTIFSLLVLICFILLNINLQSQQCEVKVTDVTFESSNSLTFDVYLKNNGTSNFIYSHGSFAWTIDPAFLNGGTPTFSLVAGYSDFSSGAYPPSALFTAPNIIRTSSNMPGSNGTILPGQILRLYRFRLQTSASSFNSTQFNYSWKSSAVPYTRLFSWDTGTGVPGEISGSNLKLLQQLIDENFDYAAGQLTNAGGGANVSNGNWSTVSGAGLYVQVIDGNLAYPGYPASNIGRQISIVSSTASAEDVRRGFTDATSGKIYFAFLVNIPNQTGLDAVNGNYFAHFTNVGGTGSGFHGRVYVRTNGTNIQFGLRARTDNATEWVTSTHSVGAAHLIVVGYEIVVGDDNNIAKLWVDPNFSGPEPGSDVTSTCITSPTNSDPDGIDAFGIRQGYDNSVTTPNANIDGIRVGTSWSDLFPATGAPSIIVSPSTLSGFTYLAGGGPSTSQSYNLSGTDLSPASGDITVTGSTNYEVSLNNTSFSSGFNVGYTGGVLATTPIYVRLKSGLAGGVYNGEIVTNSGGGATTQNVTCNGAVVKLEPSNHATDFAGVLGNPNYHFIDLSWIDATGATLPDGYLIKGSDVGFASITDPIDGTPVANSFLAQNVLQGLQTFAFGLNSGTTYFFKIYPYTNSGTAINYKIDGSVPQFTLATTIAPSLPITENFEYATGSALTSNGWIAHSNAGTNPISVNATPLTYSGYINSGLGKSVNLINTGEDDNRVFSSVTSNSIYASFMVNVTDAQITGTSFDPYVFHFAPENSTTLYFAKVLIKKDASGNIAFGVAKNLHANAVYTPFNYSLNTTYLIVVKYTFITGTPTDDEARLWINPVLDGSEPVADIIQTDGGTDALSLGMFALRQGTTANAPTLILGGIRVAETWIPGSAPTTFLLNVNVTLGWNMVSAPGTNPAGMGVATWWPRRTGTVWGFNGTQYVVKTVTTPGEGYWMKNTVAEIYNYPAIQIVAHNPIPVTNGWNMIGGYETSPTIANLKAANLQITGTVWGFNGTQYIVASNLVPGSSYWVKVTSAGNITIPNTLSKGGEVVELFKKDWGRIILTDAAGLSFTLYSVKGEVDLAQYEMPPMPPTGMFDIRFSSGRMAEDISSSIQTIDMSGITYPLTVRVEGMDIRLQDATGNAINVNLKSGEDVVISNASIQKLMVSSQLIPEKYALEQNYPNPFNPSTKIEFSIPEDVNNVTLTIYNTLGQRVAELVNSKLEAGYYSYVWDAGNVATGLYIYELRTDKFVSVKKMMLLK